MYQFFKEPEITPDNITSDDVIAFVNNKYEFLKRPAPDYITADDLIDFCEQEKLGWSLDHTGILIEARIWEWPHVKGRYRPTKVEPLAIMLWMALRDAYKDTK